MHRLTRRTLLRTGLLGAPVALGLPALLRSSARALTLDDLASAGPSTRERVLVVVELAGGNDGLNTIVPVENAAYYDARPDIAVPKEEAIALGSGFGLHDRLVGLAPHFERGRVAVVHGCGYERPDRSHFTSMRYWHTASPHRGEAHGWLGRAADTLWPDGPAAAVVGLGAQESLALRSQKQAPIVFEEPARYARIGDPAEEAIYAELTQRGAGRREALGFLRHIARTATLTSQRVREATAAYETPVSYGASFPTVSRDLRNVAALLAADFPARIYHLSYGGWDTHSTQKSQQGNQLQYLGDALAGFQDDLDRLGRSDDVLVFVYTEFGRRVAQNASGGTDHGAATPTLLIGSPVAGGFYEPFPSLEDLDDGDLRFTTDFRRVYATVLNDWLDVPESRGLLGGTFEPVPALRGAGTTAT